MKRKRYDFTKGEIHQFLLDSGYVTIHGASKILDYCYDAKKDHPTSVIILTMFDEEPNEVTIDVWNFSEDDLLGTISFNFEDINK
jgi:hypothetical protein